MSDLRDAAIEAHRGGDLAAAKPLYRMYLERRPNDAPLWSNLGALFRAEKNHELAAACQRRALQIDGDSESILNNAANAFFDIGSIQEALVLRHQALEKDPTKSENFAGLAKCLRALSLHADAEAVLHKGLESHPEDSELHIQLSFAQLAQGNYKDGFKSFHWRWKGDEISPPEFDFPQWAGESLKGKKILVTPEQGFGDTVLMARFLGELKKKGANVQLLCKRPLSRLLSEADGVDGLPQTNRDVDGCDYWTPIMDLPRYLNAELDNLAAPVKLHLPQDSIDRAKAIAGPYEDVFKLGVMWSGSVTYRANHKRSFSHTNFMQLADIEGLKMFSLYKGPLIDAFHEDGSSCIILDAASHDRDFADSAALIRELDLVVTMDSAIAHVAGSLGVEVWNLLHSESYWLYQPFAEHTPWYPSMRLIRQEKAKGWQPIFDQLHSEIGERVKQKLDT